MLVTHMCGIFGFALRQPVPMARVFGVLERLEVHQYPNEETPVGGYGAGVAILENDGNIIFEKIGKASKSSPAEQLARIVKASEASVLVGHVRMPSLEFMETAMLKETAQPYVVRSNRSTVVSVHNGKVENYEELRTSLGVSHVFESEKADLIDSEVIPHVFEELLDEKLDVGQALLGLFWRLQGRNAIVMLHVGEERSYLHFVHKGWTRGLNIWSNEKNEFVFCSREEPLMEEFGNLLAKGGFSKKISIGYHEIVGLVMSHPLPVR
jgi:glucosamine 6-phosphate synthetase-like amidotransferase/phosphosugar isomerase protein